jgi:plastocyanin
MALLVVSLVAMTPSAAHSSIDWAVMINGGGFDPGHVTIDVGDSVTWINNDGNVHAVVSNSSLGDSWSSGSLVQRSSFTHAFAQAGDYSYYDGFFPELTGTVTVRQPVPEFPGSLVSTSIALCVFAALFVERRMGRDR